MKILQKGLWMGMIAIMAGVALFACSHRDEKSATDQTTATKTKEERKVEYWTCSMHPQVKEPQPENCPFCGMKLVPVHTPAGKEAKVTSSGEVHLTEEGVRQAGVRTERVRKRRLAKELLIFGALGYDMNRHRDVVSLVEGRIEKQWIDFNQTEVREGDPLVKLYSQEALRLQEEYLKSLRDHWLSTFYERKLLDSMIALAEEKLQRIGFNEKHLRRLREEREPTPEIVIRSPITGSIIANMVHIGETVKPEMPLYHIVPLDHLWFNAQVFEPDLGLLKLGQTVRINTKSFPGEIFPGKLAFIGRSLDTSNRTVPVRFTVPNPDRRLLPNLSASGQLEIPLDEAVLSVPNSAVLDLGTRHVVYLQKERGLYISRNIRVGHITTHYIQVLEGVSEGDEVVIAGAFLIDAQAQLRGEGSSTEGQGRGTTNENEPVPAPAPPEHHH